MQVRGINVKDGFQGFEVLVVLPQRVLEFERAFVELLRPLRLVLAAEDPAAHVLRFQHEDAVGREEYVVDLRGAVRRIERDIVQAAVGLLIKLPMGKQPHQEFANMALAQGDLSRPISSISGINHPSVPQTCAMMGVKSISCPSYPELAG